MSGEKALPAKEDLRKTTDLCSKLLVQIDRILLGQGELHKMVLIGLLAKGHILLEGLPGLGKTALVKALSQILGLDFKRVQFTPDLMPSDILGTHILEDDGTGHRAMIFKPGPVFTNLMLADEINRASPKTQSAMLETMQERCVTLLGTTRQLPDPFFVLASQNPIELEGTYPLPEAQLDRFLFRLMVTRVDSGIVSEIISNRRHGEAPVPDWVMSKEDLMSIYKIMDEIYLSKAVADYISRIVDSTHPESKISTPYVRDYVKYGASPRAAIAIAEGARAKALIEGRATAGFEDVKTVVLAALNHRIILNYKARFDKMDSEKVIASILDSVKPVEIDLPPTVELEKPGK